MFEDEWLVTILAIVKDFVRETIYLYYYHKHVFTYSENISIIICMWNDIFRN